MQLHALETDVTDWGVVTAVLSAEPLLPDILPPDMLPPPPPLLLHAYEGSWSRTQHLATCRLASDAQTSV